MTISKPHLMTKMLVWAPKYSAQEEYGEYVALLHKKKVDFASPVILVEFNARHLAGQRFCIKKTEAQKHKIGTNGKALMYEVPMSHFESWESTQEMMDLINNIFEG